MDGFPGSIAWPAHNTNTLGPPCNPKGWVLHTPEERADDYPGTPYWFAKPNVGGSTHYFVSYLGFVWQCVDEGIAPIANGVLGKPYPSWANDQISLNRQSLSVEIEGYAATIGRTLWAPQRSALLRLLDYGCAKYNFPVDRAHIIGHYQVATNRTDPGTLDIDALVAEMQQPEGVFTMLNDSEQKELLDKTRALYHYLLDVGLANEYRIWHDPRSGGIYYVTHGEKYHFQSPDELKLSGYQQSEVEELPSELYAAFDAMS